MKDENGDMAPDGNSETVEISRGSRNREISGGVVGKLSGGTLTRRGKPFREPSGGTLTLGGNPFGKLSE